MRKNTPKPGQTRAEVSEKHREMNQIERLMRLWPVPDRREIWDWARGTAPEYADAGVTFDSSEGFPGPFNIENVPWIKEMMRAFKSPHVRTVTFIGPPQESGKTKGAEVCLAYTIAKSPCKMAFNTSTNTKSGAWNDTRWQGVQKAAPEVRAKLSSNPNDETKKRIVFADGTFLLVQGAETESNRQGDSVQVQINDELHLWDRPWVKQMHSRTHAFPDTCTTLNISLGADKGSELHELFLEGNQGEWCHHCPGCGKIFEYVFHNKSPQCNIRFDMTKVKVHENGTLDLREFNESVYVECLECRHQMKWSPELMAKLNAGGTFVSKNPDADPQKVSLHANSFAIGKRPWHVILKTWVYLNVKGGVFARETLRAFICEDLAEFWEERPYVVSKTLKKGSYVRAEMMTRNPEGSARLFGNWEQEWIRTMQVDNQQGGKGDIQHRFYTVRAMALNGDSRLVTCGRADEWSEIRRIQQECGVLDYTDERPGPWVVADRRHDPVEVDTVCARYRWYGLMGHHSDDFPHGPDSRYPDSRQLFSEERRIDIGYGTGDFGRSWACYYLWSSQKVQDVLAILRDGKGPKFEVPADIDEWCPEYAEHINSHRSIMVDIKKSGQAARQWVRIGGWPDHLYDCESMWVVLALMAGVFPLMMDEKKEEEPQNAVTA